MRSRTAAMLCACLALPVFSGCASDPKEGYSFSSAHSEEFKTIAIEVFENDTFSTGIEAQISEAVAKEIMRTTKWKVTSARRADTVLSGTVTTSELRALSSDQRTGLAQEMAVRLTVDFDWRNNRSGKTIVSRRSFTATDTFVPAIRTGERIDIGEANTVDDLAKSIVAELRSSW